MLAASFMLQNYISPQPYRGMHIYTRIHQCLQSLNGTCTNRLWKKLYIQIEVNDMRRSRALDNHLVPIRTS